MSAGAGRPGLAAAQLGRRRAAVGAGKPSHIEDAVASLEIELTEDEVAALESPYTPRNDWQGVSDPQELARISAKFGIKPA